MTEKSMGLPIIVNAIMWAAVMIGTSLVLGDVDIERGQKMTLLFIQIGGWFGVNSALVARR
jgi:hypothetical protein